MERVSNTSNTIDTANVTIVTDTSNVFAQAPKYLVEDILPEPKNEFTVTYERIVLDNKYVLSKLPENSILEIWRTHPTIPISNVAPTSNIIEIKGTSHLRELDDYSERKLPSQYDTLNESKVTSFATVAAMGIQAVGPHDEYIFEKPAPSKITLAQHTNFSIVQKELKFVASPPYIGNTITVEINPKECGDLISHMYLKCSLPPNLNYTDRTGRAILKRVEFYLNEQLIDFYDDDWAIIHDELFLTADESIALDSILNPPDMIIPLKLFFCNKDVYLPVCALSYQRIYIKFFFNSQSWFTDYPNLVDIINPSLVFDQIFLTTEERNYYKTNKLEFMIPTIYSEVPKKFTEGFIDINMSTSNPAVSMLVWFLRNTTSDYTTRYDYGYVSKLVNSYTTFTDWKGRTVNYVPVIDYVDIFINNKNIVSGISGDLFFTYKQPMEHGLSVPDKTIYTYCFSYEPKNYTKRGDIDFRKLDSKTTILKLKFVDSLVPQLVQSYNLNIYYFGYKPFVIDNGFGS